MFREEGLLSVGAGVIDRYIEPAKPFYGAINQTAHIFLLSNISPHEFSLSVARAKFRDQAQAHLIVATRDDEPSALLCKCHRRGAANSSQCTGYKNNCRTHMTSGNIQLHAQIPIPWDRILQFIARREWQLAGVRFRRSNVSNWPTAARC
jgi:hypothetical protein